MKMKRGRLQQIVKEEVGAYAGRLLREKEGEHPDLEDAEGDEGGEGKTKPASDRQPDNRTGKPVGKKDAAPPEGEVPGDDEEKPTEDDPNDSELEKQATGEESADDDEEDDEMGAEDTEKLGDQLVGQTIQSITANPKSKMMPGAVEIVFQFQQKPDPLKILVTKSGKIVYYYKGLHNEI